MGDQLESFQAEFLDKKPKNGKGRRSDENDVKGKGRMRSNTQDCGGNKPGGINFFTRSNPFPNPAELDLNQILNENMHLDLNINSQTSNST